MAMIPPTTALRTTARVAGQYTKVNVGDAASIDFSQ
jgi:hypothetical protein